MRITINVLYREVLYILEKKGYTIIKSYNNCKDASKIWAKLGTRPYVAIYIMKMDRYYIYTIGTIKNVISTKHKNNFLANLRLFIEGEL